MTATLDYYETNALSLGARYESAKVDELHALLNKTFAASNRLIEVGCGSGRDAAMLAGRGCVVTAVDGSAAMLEVARRQHPEVDFVHLVLPEKFPFSDECFDGFFSIACLMHFSEAHIAQILAELCRICKKGAKAIVSVPSQRGDINESGLDEHGRVFYCHSEQVWIKILANAGFSAEVEGVWSDALGREQVRWLNLLATKK